MIVGAFARFGNTLRFPGAAGEPRANALRESHRCLWDCDYSSHQNISSPPEVFMYFAGIALLHLLP